MADRLHIPAHVRLPSAPTLPQWHLSLAIGADRKRLSRWRKVHGFPRSIREGRSVFVITSDVVEWLQARGVRTEII